MKHITRYPEYKDSLEKIQDTLFTAIGDHGAVDYSPHISSALDFKKSDITNRLCTALQMLEEIEEIFESCLVESGKYDGKSNHHDCLATQGEKHCPYDALPNSNYCSQHQFHQSE